MEPGDEQIQNPPARPPRGRFNTKLDEKGRFKLPSAFQKYLSVFPDKGLFVTSIDRTTVKIYPNATWDANLELLSNQTGPNKAYAKTLLFNAQDLGADAEMDGSGRVMFDSFLREKLKLDSQTLHFYWQDGHISVLTDELYQKACGESIANTATAVEAMEGVGLR